MEISTLYNYFKECGKVTTDTRNCPEGSMFIALKGETFNGNAFAKQVREYLACIVLVAVGVGILQSVEHSAFKCLLFVAKVEQL